MPSGGDIVEITYNNPEIGSGTLRPKSSEDSMYDLGGVRTLDDPNMIDGAGRAIYQMNRRRPEFTVKCAWDWDNQDLETITALSAVTSETSFTFTNINQTVYKLVGKMVGDIQGNGNVSTVDIKVAGSGTMTIL